MMLLVLRKLNSLHIQSSQNLQISVGNTKDNQRLMTVPFPEPVNTKTRGQIPDGSPRVAISSPTEITAALAAARDEYI